MKHRILLFCTLLATATFLTACGGGSNVRGDQRESAEALYGKARKALDRERYLDAVEFYNTLNSAHPFGDYARQSQLELIYAHFMADQPESAVAAADRFIRQYPRHPQIDYVFYVRGLVDYERAKQWLEGRFYLGLDSAKRDPTPTQRAFESFQALLNGYPNSQYADDARARMAFLRERMARHELHVADYYLRRRAYIGALRRGEYVIEHYQNTRAARDALEIMRRAYSKLNMFDMASDMERVIEANRIRDKNPPAPSNIKPPPPGFDTKLGA